MDGAMPNTISTIFDSSSTPRAMNKIGSTARGGIIDSTLTSGDNDLRTYGMSPVNTPTVRPMPMLIATPVSSRLKLATVSTQSTTSPVRRLSSVASRTNVLVIVASDGSSLSSAFSASRLADAATYTASKITNGSAPSAMPRPRSGLRLMNRFTPALELPLGCELHVVSVEA
jgi:hypothetical protein